MSLSSLRVATWNLDRRKNRRRLRQARLDQLQAIDADIWVVTETDASVELGDLHRLATVAPKEVGYADTESFAAIHSRYAMRGLPTSDAQFAVCAEIPESPLGPLVVYGSIITYHFDGVREGEAKAWARHHAAVRTQAADWLKLRQEYPTHMLIVAGDFNQALDGVGKYRNRTSTDALWSGLEAAGLRCLIATDFPAEGKLESRHSVDHIAVSEEALESVEWIVSAWEGSNANGKFSDHNGVCVTFSSAGRWRDASGREVILQVVAEGGSYTLYGVRTRTGWKYDINVVDQTPVFMDEQEILRTKAHGGSVDAALSALPPYWPMLAPVKVHPEFRSRILRCAEERLGDRDHRRERVLDRWREACVTDRHNRARDVRRNRAT